MDLPFVYNVNGNLEIVENDRNQSIATIMATGTRFLLDGNRKKAGQALKNEITSMLSNVMAGGQDPKAQEARKKVIASNQTKADIIMFSGCKDMQTSADTSQQGEAGGAMSFALIKTLEKHHRDKKDLTYTELLREMRQVLEGKYTQVPQLSAGRRLVLDHPFRV